MRYYISRFGELIETSHEPTDSKGTEITVLEHTIARLLVSGHSVSEVLNAVRRVAQLLEKRIP